jgi:hypothetical protein
VSGQDVTASGSLRSSLPPQSVKMTGSVSVGLNLYQSGTSTGASGPEVPVAVKHSQGGSDFNAEVGPFYTPISTKGAGLASALTMGMSWGIGGLIQAPVTSYFEKAGTPQLAFAAFIPCLLAASLIAMGMPGYSPPKIDGEPDSV